MERMLGQLQRPNCNDYLQRPIAQLTDQQIDAKERGGRERARGPLGCEETSMPIQNDFGGCAWKEAVRRERHLAEMQLSLHQHPLHPAHPR